MKLRISQSLKILGEELGMDIELVKTEASVGPFRLDILAKDARGDVTIIIENQLDMSDHGHLGQLLTYAAGFDAKTVIWIADGFRDEHRSALDWLNKRTTGETRFFAVQVEVFRIDDSAPAPHFKVIASPDNWSKQTKSDSTDDISPRMMKYRSFFQQLIDELREVHHFTNAKIGQPASYYFFSSGHSDIKYGSSFVQGNKARIELNIDGDKEWNNNLIEQLEMIRSEIEVEFNETVEWERLDHARSNRISILRSGSIESSENELDDIRVWMIKNLLKFKEVFAPRLPELMKQKDQ